MSDQELMMRKSFDFHGMYMCNDKRYLLVADESLDSVECDGCDRIDHCPCKVITYTDLTCTPGSVTYTIYEILYDHTGVPRALFEVDGGLFGYCDDTSMRVFYDFLYHAHYFLDMIEECDEEEKEIMNELLEDSVVA